jgi:hypothetical protein
LNLVRLRLPKVIVPVLSSSSVSTSPAASTARPDLAITFAFTSRSMPAMPMADSRPPIVVGYQRDEAARSEDHGDESAGINHEARLQGDDDDQEDHRHAGKQDVERNLVRRLLAFGAFDHRDHAIEEAGAGPEVILHLDPVGHDTSAARDGRAVAAASRMTGADSPVIAASLTEATPSMISPSAG